MQTGSHAGSGEQIVGRIERLPMSRWHTKMRAIIGVAWFFDGFDALAIAFVLPALIPEFHLAPFQIGLLISGGYAGQAVGSVFFGWWAGRVGRVPAAVWTLAIFSIGSLACALSWSFASLLVIRFIQGLGLGGEIPIMQSYINELSRAHRRGRFALLTQLPFAFGITITGLVAIWVVPTLGWRWMFLIGAVPALAIFPLRRMLPESPRWLASRGRFADADAAMTQIEQIITAERGGAPLPPIPTDLPHTPPAHPALADLFRGVYASRTISLWVIWISTYFVGYGLTGWLPTIYGSVYKLPLQKALSYGFYSSAALFIGGVFVTFLVDRTGRKSWIATSLILNGVALAFLAGASSMTAAQVLPFIIVASLFNGSVSLLIGPYAAENYPTQLRALGVGIGNAWLRAASVVSPFIVGWMLGNGGVDSVFIMFAIVLVFGGVVCALLATETKERVLEDVSPVL